MWCSSSRFFPPVNMMPSTTEVILVMVQIQSNGKKLVSYVCEVKLNIGPVF